MKIRIPQAALGLLSLLSLSSCYPDHDFVESASDIMTQGRWTVDHFYENGDQTANYAPYTLQFNPNGTFTLSGADANGTWTVIHDETRNEVVMLTVQSPKAELNELSGEWTVTGKSPERMLMTNRVDEDNAFRIRRAN